MNNRKPLSSILFLLIISFLVASFVIGCGGGNGTGGGNSWIPSPTPSTSPTSSSTPSPYISFVNPDAASEGEEITINGSGFGDEQADSTVTFNGMPGTVTGWSDKQITCPVPKGAISGDVVVMVQGVQSNGVSLIVIRRWARNYGGSNNEKGVSVNKTSDGGYIVGGETESNDGDVSGNHGDRDYWVTKLNISGDIEWQKCLGGTGTEVFHSIYHTSDGGCILAGDSNSNDGDVFGNHGGYDYWVVKLDSLGNMEWQKCFGGSDRDVLSSILQTKDGGFILAGHTLSDDGDILFGGSTRKGSYDVWIVKLTPDGNIDWQKCYGGSNVDFVEPIQQTSDGGYIFAGHTLSNDDDVSGNHGGYDYWVVKIDPSGNLQWQKCYGGVDNDFAHSIVQTKDSGFIVAGHTLSNSGDVSGNHGGYDFWVVKVDDSGTIQWKKCLGGQNDDFCSTIYQLDDHKFIVSGFTNSTDGDVIGNHGDFDYWMVKLDVDGLPIWQKCLGGSNTEENYCLHPTEDGFIIAGESSSLNGDVSNNYGGFDSWIVKLGPDGNLK